MKKNLLVLFLLLSVSFSTFAQTATKKNSPAIKASAEITAKQLSDYLYFVASDEMEGRDTPSRGLDTTAKFIGMNLSRWGFKPAGDNGTFYQKIALRRDVADMSQTKLEVGGQSFVFGEDFLRLAGEGTVANAGLVYGKDGWFVQAKNIDPYQGVDVKGKVVVLYTEGFPSQRGLTNPPVPRNELKPAERGTTWADPVTYAKQKGAVGIILVASPMVQASWEQAKMFLGGGGMYPEKLRDAPAEKQMPVMIVSRKVGDSIFPIGQNPTKTGETLTSANLEKQVNMGIITKPEIVYTQNVVAIWEGSDPVLKNEMVAIGAHYDHEGMSPNSLNADKISNGADDDGSGTVAVLAIAEALGKSKIRPKRSMLLVWHCGEEKGLWGSEYFNKFPTVDIKQVTVQLNIDMIGRSRKTDSAEPRDKELSGENSIYVIGSNMMSSKLGEIVANTNKAYLKMDYDFRFDDPKDPNRFFFRSDHFNYAVNGIPISFWFDGVHVDYHGVGDEPSKIDYVKMEKVARTIFLTMWELGDLKERPKIDKELPKELTQR
jgi:Peptidase family M28/PA domain